MNTVIAYTLFRKSAFIVLKYAPLGVFYIIRFSSRNGTQLFKAQFKNGIYYIYMITKTLDYVYFILRTFTKTMIYIPSKLISNYQHNQTVNKIHKSDIKLLENSYQDTSNQNKKPKKDNNKHVYPPCSLIPSYDDSYEIVDTDFVIINS